MRYMELKKRLSEMEMEDKDRKLVESLQDDMAEKRRRIKLMLKEQRQTKRELVVFLRTGKFAMEADVSTKSVPQSLK